MGKVIIKQLIVLLCAAIIFTSSMFFLLYIDSESTLHPENIDENILVQLIEDVGIRRFNIEEDTWKAFVIIFASCLFIFFINAIKPIFKYKIAAHPNNSIDIKQKKIAKLNSIYKGVFIVLLAIICGAIYIANNMGYITMDYDILYGLLQTTLYFMCYVLGVPLSIYIIASIIKMVYNIIVENVSEENQDTDTEEIIDNSESKYQAQLEIAQIIKELSAIEKETQVALATVAPKEVAQDSAETNAFSFSQALEEEKEEEDDFGFSFGDAFGFGSDDDIAMDSSQATTECPVNQVIFPGLIEIDGRYESGFIEDNFTEEKIGLDELCYRFQSYLCNNCDMYYNIEAMRSFIAGLASSRLLILEGLSGTGKTSLPRLFGDFIKSKAFICPVQSTWRDRSDVIGYFNDFAGVYKETRFLKTLYEASYTNNTPNLMVLDEMNLSRVEYYFADFLSILEYPSEDWKLELMPLIPQAHRPKNVIESGSIMIPTNTWFIGTGNTDDSTFAITDKVYDRAVVIDFEERNEPIESMYDHQPIAISNSQLLELFNKAVTKSDFKMSNSDLDKFLSLCTFVFDTFDITFGNRIMNQIKVFVPVYVACGGSKEQAIDLMFAKKIMRKLEGKYDDYIKDGLFRLITLINNKYGKGVFVETEKVINKLRRKLV